nr:MAG TPA: hypothetical protein [Caudoviricetes sp.]
MIYTISKPILPYVDSIGLILLWDNRKFIY